MNMRGLIGSSLLSADKLEANVRYEKTVVDVTKREFDDGAIKPIVHFDDGTSCVLNTTRGTVLAMAYGYESDNYVGRTIIIRQGDTTYGGKPTKCIVFEIPDKSRLETKATANVRRIGGESK
jgi:hypothetical protein